MVNYKDLQSNMMGFMPSASGSGSGEYSNFPGSRGEDYISKYNLLKNLWAKEIRLSSSIGEMMDLSSFKEIVAMGEIVIPLIIQDLWEERSFIYLALPEILGEDPTPAALDGRPEDQVEAWLSWAERTGMDQR